MLSLSRFQKFSLLVCFILTGLAIYSSFQFSHYHQTIGKVISEEVLSNEPTTDEHSNKDQRTTKSLSIKLLNNHYKGKTIKTENTSTYSQIKDHNYHKNDYVFVEVKNEDNQLTGTIIELKRDSLLIGLVGLFIMLLIVVSGKYGLFTFFSFIVNGLMLGAILIWYRSINSQLLVVLLMLTLPIIILTTLTIANGWNFKTKVAVVSTLIGSLITFMLGFVVIELLGHRGLHYEEMELVTRPPHVLFLSSLLIGCVGAVMDVSMTIISSLFELIQTKQTVTTEELQKTGRQIGEDIMGPMTNIMFFSYLSGAIPLVIIFLRNDMSFTYTFNIILSLELARALVGSIGIMLAIPISIRVTHFFLKKRCLNDC